MAEQNDALDSSKNSFSILIADDSETMRFVLKNQLRRHPSLMDFDVKIHEAIDGVDAIKKHQKVGADLIFLDIHMPEKDGLEALTDLIKIDKSAYIIMLTSDNTAKNVKIAITHGVKGYAIKPISPKKITEIMKKYFTQMDLINNE